MGYLTKRRNSTEIYVDTDIIAFHVPEDEADDVTEYLVSAITAHSMALYGDVPRVLCDTSYMD